MSGFNLGGAVNSAASWACGAPIIRTVVGNPVFTALLITALVAIVALGLYHYAIKQAGAKRGARALLYTFLLVTAVVFVHHYAVMRTARDAASQKGIRDMFSSIQQSREGGFDAGVPVVPWGLGEEPARRGQSPAAVGGCDSCAEGAARPPAARPDNVAPVALDGVVIEDVVLPAGPFRK